jgi:hypothetical protein
VDAQHQFGGALLGEHLGQLLVIGWSATLSVVILRSRLLPRWLGLTGLAVSALYLLNQGDILATALPGFPVWDLAGLLGSTGWGLWIAALGVTLLLRPVRHWSPATHNGVDIPGREHPRRPAGRGRAEELSTMARSGASRPLFLWTWLIWTAGFPRLPHRRVRRHRGGRPRGQSRRGGAGRRDRRARHRRRPGTGQFPATRPAQVDTGHRGYRPPRSG